MVEFPGEQEHLMKSGKENNYEIQTSVLGLDPDSNRNVIHSEQFRDHSF
jgi:hypothetical protein